MADFIEGKRPVIEALRTHVPLKYILMADNLSQGDSLVRDIQRKAKNLDVPIKKVSKKKLDEISERGSHQGVMAEGGPVRLCERDDDPGRGRSSRLREHDGRALIVVLDHITDAGNLGAIARSAECVGASRHRHSQQARRPRDRRHLQKLGRGYFSHSRHPGGDLVSTSSG